MEAVKRAGIMKRDAVGRVSYTEGQREALLDEFERSELKGVQFARAAGVKYQTFAHWVQQRRHDRGDYGRGPKVRCAALRLVEAVVAAPQAGPGQAASLEPGCGPLEVLLPGGAKVQLGHASQVPLVAQLLQALRPPC
jgi:hypothetical protein